MKAIYGLYPNPHAAQRALDALNAMRPRWAFRDRDIAVISGEPYEDYGFGQRDRKTAMPWLAVLGGLTLGLCGFAFISYAQRVYPLNTGGMPIVTAYPLGIIVYELTMLGATLTAVVTLLITARIPDWSHDKLYDPAVSKGKILIGVINPPEAGRSEIRSSLETAGAETVKEIDQGR